MSLCRRTSWSPVTARWRSSTPTSALAMASFTSSARPPAACQKHPPWPRCSPSTPTSPTTPLAENLRQPQPGFSYTQWEAYLAIHHQRPLFVYRPTDFELDALHVCRDAKFVFSPSEARAQKAHYQRISALGHDRGQFLNEERLSSAVAPPCSATWSRSCPAWNRARRSAPPNRTRADTFAVQCGASPSSCPCSSPAGARV